MLEENYKLNGLVISCSGQNIVLSCILYDLDMTIENGKEQFQKLFKKADEFDDILKRDYECTDRLTDK